MGISLNIAQQHLYHQARQTKDKALMGLLNLFRRLWRFLHPQWTAMTPKQINEIDRAVAESMAKGSFTTRHRPTPAPPTADQLWTDTGDATSEYAYAGGGGGSDRYMPPLPNETARLWSMSSRGGVSVGSSSRGRDSGYAEQRPPSSRSRKYTPSPQQQQQHHYSYYGPSNQHWGASAYEPEPYYHHYYYDEQQLQYAQPQYPPASYYPEGGYARAYVPPVGESDGIVAGQPVNAPY